MGQRLVIVFLSPGRMCLIHSVPVEFSRLCAVSIGELAFLPPLDLSVFLSDPVAPSLEENFEVPMRVGSSSSLLGLSCLTSSLSFPGCSHPGLVVAPSPGFDFTGLVIWSLLAPRSWEPPSQSTPFSRSVAFWRLCGASYSPPLVSSLSAARLGLWPYGLAIAALPLVSRPWTGFCWSHLLSLNSVSVCSWCY